MSANDLELVFTSSALLGTALLILSGLGVGRRLRIPTRWLRLHLPFLRRDDATATHAAHPMGLNHIPAGPADGEGEFDVPHVDRHLVVEGERAIPHHSMGEERSRADRLKHTVVSVPMLLQKAQRIAKHATTGSGADDLERSASVAVRCGGTRHEHGHHLPL